MKPYRNISCLVYPLLGAEYIIHPETWGFFTWIKSFNLRKVMEAAKITLSPSYLEQFRQRRTEIVRISYEFKMGSIETSCKVTFPIGWKPKGTWQHVWTWDRPNVESDAGRTRSSDMSDWLSEEKEGIGILGNHEMPWLFASMMNTCKIMAQP